MNEHIPPTTPDESPAPDWLTHLLRDEYVPSPGYALACREAGHAALALAQMRARARRTGLSLQAIPEYLRTLAGGADLTLQAVLGWAGLDLRGGADAHFARGWGRIAQALRLGLREAKFQMRLTLASEAGLGVALQTLRDESDGAVTSEDYFGALAEKVDLWEEPLRARLKLCEGVLERAYRAGADDPA